MAVTVKKSRSAATSRAKSETAPGKAFSPQQISVEAYYNYLQRIKNNSPGNEMSDWLEAEKTLQMSISR